MSFTSQANWNKSNVLSRASGRLRVASLLSRPRAATRWNLQINTFTSYNGRWLSLTFRVYFLLPYLQKLECLVAVLLAAPRSWARCLPPIKYKTKMDVVELRRRFYFQSFVTRSHPNSPITLTVNVLTLNPPETTILSGWNACVDENMSFCINSTWTF